jgi:hypothetical protein
MYAEVANVFFSTGQPIALERQHRGPGMPLLFLMKRTMLRRAETALKRR